jgi:hypothetical protein
MTTILVGEDVRPPRTPTECVHSLGRFNDGQKRAEGGNDRLGE